MEKVLNAPIQAVNAEIMMKKLLKPTHQTIIAGNVVKGSYGTLVILVNATGKIGHPIVKIN